MTYSQTDRLILRDWQDSEIEVFTAINQDPKVMGFNIEFTLIIIG